MNALTIGKLADMFHARAGADDATARTYHKAMGRASRSRTRKVRDALAPHLGNPAAMKRIWDLLATPGKQVRATC